MSDGMTGQLFESPEVYTAGEDLTGYEGRAVYLDAGLLKVASSVDQATTQTLRVIGILTQGADTDTVGGCRVATGPNVPVVAGTGGFAIGDSLFPEYAASGLNRGRLIAVAPGSITTGNTKVGDARSIASAGGNGWAQVFPAREK